MTFSGVFAIGVSGVNAFATSLETVSSNIANSQTTGFKRARTDFSELVTIDAPENNGRLGAGVSALQRQLVAEQGAVTRTNTETNIAVSGDGFFVVSESADANPASSPFLFTRSGDFAPNANGELVNGAGYFLRGFTVSADGSSPTTGGLNALSTVNIETAPPTVAGAAPTGALLGVEIDARGRVIGSYASGEQITLYQIPVALFTNANGLEEAEGTAFRTTTGAGEMTLALPQAGRAGAIEGSALEISTVDIGQEFATLIETQRAYSTNARLISAADELWRTLIETAV